LGRIRDNYSRLVDRIFQNKRKKRKKRKEEIPIPRGPPPRRETCKILDNRKHEDEKLEVNESQEKSVELKEDEDGFLDKLEDLWGDVIDEILEASETESKGNEEDDEITEIIENEDLSLLEAELGEESEAPEEPSEAEPSESEEERE